MFSKYGWESVVISFVTFVVYFITINPVLAIYAPFFLVVSLVSIVFLCLFLLTSLEVIPQRVLLYRFLLFSSVTAILLAVGLSGWFNSPFFYLIYCMALALAFVFNALTSFTFVLTIVALLLLRPNLLYNLTSILALCSLFLLVPFAYIITRLHLQFKQKEKDILILQEEVEQTSNETKAQQALHNKVIRFVAAIREDLSDIKQLTFLVNKNKSSEAVEKHQQEIMFSVEDALERVKIFEAEVTGSRLMDNP